MKNKSNKGTLFRSAAKRYVAQNKDHFNSNTCSPKILSLSDKYQMYKTILLIDDNGEFYFLLETELEAFVREENTINSHLRSNFFSFIK